MCGDETVYAMYWPWTMPEGAGPGSLVSCSIRANHYGGSGAAPSDFCPNSTAVGYCEPARGSALDCVLLSAPIVTAGPSAGAIAGAVIGALLGCAALGALAFWLRRRYEGSQAWAKGLAELGADEAEYAPLSGQRADFAAVYADRGLPAATAVPGGSSPFV